MNMLEIRQGEDFSSRLEVSVFLFFHDGKTDSVEGTTFHLNGNEDFGSNKVHIHLHWPDHQINGRKSEIFTKDYVLKLSFEQEDNGMISGKIFLEVEKNDTKISGKFTATVK